MGTNYYHRTNICPKCGRFDEKHIGKSSSGWTFSFQGSNKIRSYKDWLEILESGGKIYDEYYCEVPLDKFKKMIENKKQEKLNHTLFCRQNYSCLDTWLDDEDNSFSGNEFS